MVHIYTCLATRHFVTPVPVEEATNPRGATEQRDRLALDEQLYWVFG